VVGGGGVCGRVEVYSRNMGVVIGHSYQNPCPIRLRHGALLARA